MRPRFLGRVSGGRPPTLWSDVAPERAGGYDVLLRGYVAGRASIRDCAGDAISRSPEDAELAAFAARRWQADLPRELLGEYALAVWDAASHTLLLSHDSLGVVPLFYARHGGPQRDDLWFASHLEDLVLAIGRPDILDIDEEYVADHLARNLSYGVRTPFAGISRLGPGETLRWADGRVTAHHVPPLDWTALDGDAPDSRSPAECAEQLRALVQEAVAGAIPDGARVWCELSGGLDSSTVLGAAFTSGARQVEAVSFVYPRTRSADERQWIAPVLKRYPARWHQIDGDALPPFGATGTRFYAEPNDRYVTADLTERYRQTLADHQVDVLLTGQGGDAVFAGDGAGPHFLADLLRRGRLGELRRRLRSLVDESPQRRSHVYWLLQYAVIPSIWHARGQVVEEFFHRTSLPPWIAPAYVARLGLEARRRRRFVPRARSVAAAACLERLMTVVEALSRNVDDPEMPTSVRHPLLYRPLVELMLRVPSTAAFDAGQDRALQRRALASILPARTRARADKGARGRLFYEGLDASPAWQARLTTDARIVQRGYVDGRRWEEAIRHACLGRSTGIGDLLASSVLEAWLRRLESLSIADAPRALSVVTA